MFTPRSLVVALFALCLSASTLFAGDLRIPLPKKSKYTPVQQLNRDGVNAVEHHDYAKAKKLFYKAYLIDPNDPFTLNNLGYLAELEGDADRAQRFYQLSAEQNSEAVVDKASNDSYEGKPVSAVAGNAEDKGIKINRLNSQAIALLNKDRAPEADLILQKALVLDSKNPFTLNNLGYAKEKEGELEAAYQFYTAAASTSSRDRVEIAPNKEWRGRRISEVASDSARKLSKRLRDGDDMESRVAILNLRGVSAMNRNDRRTARDFIQQAFKLNPNDAFTLNNMGYLAELDGDRETADYYYDRARDANGAKARIALATRKDVEGKRIGELAENTDAEVLSRIERDRIARQQMGGPVVLRDRNSNAAVIEPDQPASPPQKMIVSDANGNLQIPVRNSSAGTQNPVSGDKLLMPLPEQQQPVTVHQGEIDGGLMMPLPDDQQPDAQPPDAQSPANGQPAAQQPEGLTAPPNSVVQPQQPATQSAPPATQPQAQPQQPTTAPAQTAPQQQQPGLLLPLPDNQQPPEARSPSAQPQASTPQTQSATPDNNKGVYAPPPANSTTPAQPQPPKKISDLDSNPK